MNGHGTPHIKYYAKDISAHSINQVKSQSIPIDSELMHAILSRRGGRARWAIKCQQALNFFM
jgi:hypothetical protein